MNLIFHLKIYFRKTWLLLAMMFLFGNFAQAQISAIANCTGISGTEENTYNILISGLNPLTTYAFDFDGDAVNEENAITGVSSFTANDFTFLDGTNFSLVQIDEEENGVYEYQFAVHEVLCTDADDDGNLDFNVADCDVDLPNVDNGFIVATVAPYLGVNTYVFVLTNENNNTLTANTTGLFTTLPNGDFNVVALNFGTATDANNFIDNLNFGTTGTLIDATTIPVGCAANCGTMSYNLNCRVDDVALTKVVNAQSNTTNLSIGDKITFDIEIFNQGSDEIFEIVVNDYVPSGFDFFVADNTDNAFANITADQLGGGTLTTTLAGPLASQASEIIQIVLTINANATNENLINSAEIIDAQQSPNGPSIFDEDGNLLATNPDLNDETDDDINDGLNDNPLDQDDFDLAGVTLCSEPLLVCPDVIINLNSGECESVVNFDFPSSCNSLVETNPLTGSVFPIGTTNVSVTQTDAFGNIETCNFNVIILENIPSSNSLSCIGEISLTLDEACQATISPDFLLTGNDLGCFDNYNVVVLDGDEATGIPLNLPTDAQGNPIVGMNFVGDTLTVKVVDPLTGISCWTKVFIEDKSIPDLICSDTTINCAANSSPNNLGFPVPNNATVTPTTDPVTFIINNFDSCGAINLTYTDVENGELCAANKIITRTWTATDLSENTTTCTQVITIIPTTIPEILAQLPVNITVDCGNVLPPILEDVGCENINIALNGEPVIVEICEASFKIIRTYTLVDECNNQSAEYNQFIEVVDTVAPLLTCPADITVGNTANGCFGNVLLQTPTATDACGNNITFTAEATAGILNGFQLTNLPNGIHQVTYTATDNCGNASTCTINVTVEDDIAPLAICDEHLIVGIGSDGTAIVDALTFDDGSTDNCGIIDYAVRRMDNPDCPGNDATIFTNTVPFTCCDIGSIVMVELRVQDAVGNENFCMIEVEVQDKIAPTLVCPADKNLECDAVYLSEIIEGEALPVTAIAANGMATATDNCGTVSISNSVLQNTLDNCGVGLVRIAWTATDENNNTSQCIQTYNVTNSNPFFINASDENDPTDDVIWPLDFTTTTCGSGLEPEDLSTPYNNPVITENACANIGIGHVDQVLNFGAGDACLKVLRKWYIVDWCQAASNQDPTLPGVGAWQYVQVIKVTNSAPPVISENNLESTINNFEENCDGVAANFEIFATDDCTDSIDLITNWTFSNGETGNGLSANGTFTNGDYSLTFTVNDQCGNTSTLVHNFTVRDAKKPTPVCLFGIASAIMPSSGELTLTASDFENGSSVDNCTSYENLIFSFSSATSDSLLTIACDEIPANGLVPITLYVTDEAGNFDFCSTFIEVQDPNGACPTATLLVSGIIENENQELIEEVQVNLTNPTGLPTVPPVMTGSTGNYFFNTNMGELEVTPEKDTFPLNGVTTYDLVLISKHILGTQLLDSPYKIIAADANHSNSVTTLDIITIRRVILHYSDNFTNNTSWRFVPMDFEFANPTAPFQPQFPESTNLAGMSGTVDADFIAVKIGDVNNTASTNLLGISQTRNATDDLVFGIQEQNLEAGTVVDIKFTAADFETNGYQFTLEFDPTVLEFVDMQTQLENLNKENFGLNKIKEGILTTSWHQAKVLAKEKNTALFQLQFRVLENKQLSEVFKITSRYTAAEAYRDSEMLNVVLDFSGKTIAADHFELFQNRPNPFRKNTVIGFTLPNATTATLRIFDASGKVIQEIKGDYARGYHEVSIAKETLQVRGFLIYELETPSRVARKKMLIME